jgi:enterochelin esterase-like enzyme
MRPQLALVLLLLGAPLSVAQAPSLEKDAGRSVPGQMGNSTAYVIRSSILGETRRIDIATPASFEVSGPNRRYPIVIVFDGDCLFAPKVVAAQLSFAKTQNGSEFAVRFALLRS